LEALPAAPSKTVHKARFTLPDLFLKLRLKKLLSKVLKIFHKNSEFMGFSGVL